MTERSNLFMKTNKLLTEGYVRSLAYQILDGSKAVKHEDDPSKYMHIHQQMYRSWNLSGLSKYSPMRLYSC